MMSVSVAALFDETPSQTKNAPQHTNFRCFGGLSLNSSGGTDTILEDPPSLIKDVEELESKVAAAAQTQSGGKHSPLHGRPRIALSDMMMLHPSASVAIPKQTDKAPSGVMVPFAPPPTQSDINSLFMIDQSQSAGAYLVRQVTANIQTRVPIPFYDRDRRPPPLLPAVKSVEPVLAPKEASPFLNVDPAQSSYSLQVQEGGLCLKWTAREEDLRPAADLDEHDWDRQTTPRSECAPDSDSDRNTFAQQPLTQTADSDVEKEVCSRVAHVADWLRRLQVESIEPLVMDELRRSSGARHRLPRYVMQQGLRTARHQLNMKLAKGWHY